MIPIKDKYQLRNWELVSINPNKKNWIWFDYFNYWAVSIHSIFSFSLISTLYLLNDINTIVVLIGTLVAGITVFILSNLIGNISQVSGLCFPVILRISMGFNGARYFGLIRGLVGIFMFGVQTLFISKSFEYIFRITLYDLDNQLINNFFFTNSYIDFKFIDWFSLIITLILQFLLFTRGASFNKNFIKFCSIFVYLGLIILLIIIFSNHSDALIKALVISSNIDGIISKKNILPFVSIAITMFVYFSILILNFGDFARYAKDYNELKIGNFSLLINIILFSIIAVLLTLGSDIILVRNSITIDQLITNPNDIIDKINNYYLTFASVTIILISSISSNLIANFVPPQNTLINFMPNRFTIKSAGVIILLLSLIISIFWVSIFSQKISLSFFDTLASFFGPLFGIIVTDFYFVQEKKIYHKELFYPDETTKYVYSNGWNYKAIYSILIGFIFSASTIWNANLLQFQSFGWIIGAILSSIIYLVLKK